MASTNYPDHLPFLLGIAGKAGSGKDTVADYLTSQYKACYQDSFAAPLKEAVAPLFGIDADALYDTEFKETVDPFWKVTPRQMLQFFGTDLIRNHIHKLLPEIGQDFWVERFHKGLEESYKSVTKDSKWYEPECVVVSDVRFKNEVDYILASGGAILHLFRTDADFDSMGHISEQLETIPNNTTIFHLPNNSTLEELYNSVDNILSFLPFNFIPAIKSF